MKILTLVLSLIALGFIVFNATKLDFNAPLEGDSIVALITIVASLCVILMMRILQISKRIEQKVNQNK
ncbi:hypothetical protein FEZ18_07670 [Oceanihabitans sp. IOP_32]|uniref:hypothetical protein n=1 Tax=Oceanihabitans sp. IOP_32 TaxID=2529032 RepID=UPI001294068D|nr:hypothetical protein [Oceanihabitans sp. IOP_32]QFZ54680.1 hypothetical protein FEZ18_07670 [Oceanihabitans sp. IOP_32]